MECIRCRKEADLKVRALQLRTLHVRAMTGEEKYQVPDDEVREYGVCRACADEWLAGGAGRSAGKKVAVFGLIAVAGILLVLQIWRAGGVTFDEQLSQVLRMLGAAAAVCGIAGVVSSIRDRRTDHKEFASMTPKEALNEAAWRVFLESAPKEMGDDKWRLTYIPVTEKTLATKPGDLTVIYDIQPAVAKEVMLKIGHPRA